MGSPAECEEGRTVTVRFDFPPQMRVVGDLQATTEVVVMTVLTYAVLNFAAFQELAVDMAEEPGETSREFDRRAKEMFTGMTAQHLAQFFQALTPMAGQ